MMTSHSRRSSFHVMLNKSMKSTCIYLNRLSAGSSSICGMLHARTKAEQKTCKFSVHASSRTTQRFTYKVNRASGARDTAADDE
jgi:hypothetical protein